MAATTFYFPADLAADVNPANTADWEHVQGTPVFRKLLVTPDAVALATVAVNPDGADHIFDWDSLHRTYVSAPLAAQTIAGNVTAQFQCIESHASDNLFLTIKIFRVNSAGVLQDVMLAITRKGTEPTTSLRNTTFASAALTSRTFADGDRIAIEIGLGGLPVSGSGTNCHNGSIRWGCAATSGDLPVDETQAGTTYRPWLTFDSALVFLTPVSLAATASGAPVLSQVVSRFRTLEASAVGVAALAFARLKSLTLESVSTGVAALSILSTFSRILEASATGIASLTKTVVYGRVLSAAAVGASALTRIVARSRTLIATATGIAALSTQKTAGSQGGDPVAAAIFQIGKVPVRVVTGGDIVPGVVRCIVRTGGDIVPGVVPVHTVTDNIPGVVPITNEAEYAIGVVPIYEA